MRRSTLAPPRATAKLGGMGTGTGSRAGRQRNGWRWTWSHPQVQPHYRHGGGDGREAMKRQPRKTTTVAAGDRCSARRGCLKMSSVRKTLASQANGDGGPGVQGRGPATGSLTTSWANSSRLKGPRARRGREDEAFDERRAVETSIWAAAGLTCLGWPVEHGGPGALSGRAPGGAFYEEYGRGRGTRPARSNHFRRVNCSGRRLIAFGTEEAEEAIPAEDPRRDRAVVSGAYSEPGAGKGDLANVSTAAELDGDQWVINGQ